MKKPIKLTKKQKKILEIKKQERLRLFHRLTDYGVGIVVGMLLTLFILTTYITALLPINDLMLFIFTAIILVSNSLTYFFMLRR